MFRPFSGSRYSSTCSRVKVSYGNLMRRIAQVLSVTVLLMTFSVSLATQQEFLDELRELAEAGDAEAQVTLGLAYSFGRGVPQDDVEAVRW